MDITLTIDGREVTVQAGATILEAARKAGVRIPTLCHMDGLKPRSSCFLCVVRVGDERTLVPACVAPAAGGMAVFSDTEEVRAARKTALELLLSDHRGDCIAPCSRACPAGLDIPGFIGHLLDGDERQAIALIKETIPLPASVGRVCPRYCERVCRRVESEEAVAVCLLKRFAADADLAADQSYLPDRAPLTGKKVAIVGAGPAGLSAAFCLLRRGHDCTLYDAHAEPGGMLRYGIGEFRLPSQVLDAEVDVIRSLGAAFRMGCRLGDDVSLEDLRAGHDAVFLALGAQLDGEPALPGGELCTPALAFLHEAAEGRRGPAGGATLVIGGGSEAVEAARTALRLGADPVTLVWEGDRRSMPCFSEPVDAAAEEGVRLELEARPDGVERAAAGLRVTCLRGGEELVLDAPCVIGAPERRADVALFGSMGLEVSRRGIAVERGTFVTSLPGVFAGGEAVSGPGAAVRAVAAGRSAALCIAQFLKGQTPEPESRPFSVSMGKLSDADRAELLRGVPSAPRVKRRLAPVEGRRTTFAEVERGLTAADALYEAARCLQCDCLARDTCDLRRCAAEYGASPSRFRGEPRPFQRDDTHEEVIYEPGKCILCGRCVRIAEARGEKLGIGFASRGFFTRVAVPFGGSLAEGLTETVRLCAEACPTGALAFRKRRRRDAAPQ